MLRAAAIILLICLAGAIHAQAVRINEIARAYELPVALQHVTVEVYNAGSKPANMKGMRFFLNGKFQEITHDAVIKGKGFYVFNFGKKRGDSPADLDLKLPWHGATLMLWDARGEQMLDLFIYPELLDKGSFGRCPDGAVKPAYTDTYTIGGGCDQAAVSPARSGAVQLTRTPVADGITISLQADAEAIYYTVDGSEPTEKATRYTSSILVAVKARSYSTGKHPSSVLTEAILPGDPKRRQVLISLVEEDLWDDEKGIYVSGSNSNFSRKGKAWERSAIVQTNGLDNSTWGKHEFGMRISGSGTRSLNKRSFKLFTRDRYGDAGLDFFTDLAVDEVVLRADATPNSFLQNKFIEVVATGAAEHLDVQGSVVMDLYLNGAYWGMYRAMPAKDPRWIETKRQVNGIDMLSGSAYRVVEGSDEGVDEVLQILSNKSLNSTQLERLDQLIDVQSLIQLAAFDVYTGRADHELNTRMWRPPGGKWRWILYDFDLWALADDPSLGRMLSEPNAVTPFVGTIWHTPQLQEQFLSYMCALLNGPLNPVEADRTVERIYDENRLQLEEDHANWQYLVDMIAPQFGLQELRQKVIERPGNLYTQLGKRSERAVVRVPYVAAAGGDVAIDGLTVSKANTITGWSDVLILLEAKPQEGMEFVTWKGMQDDAPLLLVELDKINKIQPVFRKTTGIKP